MYSASKDQNAAQSGTGIYYQAVPAVAANGKNIMKLIPVQMVNGQFFPTDICQPRTDSALQRSVTTNTASARVQAALNPTAAQQSCRKQISTVNDSDHGYSQNKLSLQSPIATPPTNRNKPVRRPCRVPVTVTSPALPKGHHILIPPDAEVQTVPASDLPPGIKKHICISSGSSSESNAHRVVFVSPVTTVTEGASPPNNSATDSDKRFSETFNKTSRASQSEGSKTHLKLIPKVSQRPDSPIKWVIEEDDSSRAPDHPDSSSVTLENLQAMEMSCDFIKKSPSLASKILRSLAEREKNKPRVDSEKISQSILNKSGPGQGNALVMYNGKVYFMAKKCSLLDQNDPATSTKHEFNKTTLPSSQHSVEPLITQTQQGISIVIPDESDDIIDLCDDEDSTHQEASAEEDNVIFVSYLPPKAASQANSMPTSPSPMAPEKETTMDTSGSTCLREETRLDGNKDKDEDPALRGRQVGHSALLRNAASACCSSVMMHDAQSQQVEQVERVSVDVETGSAADPNVLDRSSGTCSEKNETRIVESSANATTCCMSAPAPKPCRTADQLLRQKYGITTDVKIRLQRIDETSAWSGLEQPLESTSKANSLQDLNVSCQKRETNYYGVKKARLLNGPEFSAGPAARALHCDATLESKCPSGQSSLCGSSCGEAAPEFGYVEPIDEDFLSRHEDDVSKLQTCVELNTNTRRLGRTRKRTMCPCCTTGALEHEADRLA